jgi:hypothetical protein
MAVQDGDAVGPIDYLVLQLATDRRDGSIADALTDLVQSGTITLLDLAIVQVDADGTVAGIELDAFGGQLTAFAGARSGLIGDDELADAGGILEPGTTAAILLYENAWARPFVAAATSQGAEVLASARIPAAAVMDALDALD